MAIQRWQDDLDGTWHESGDLDASDYEGEAEAARVDYEWRQEVTNALGRSFEALEDEHTAANVCLYVDDGREFPAAAIVFGAENAETVELQAIDRDGGGCEWTITLQFAPVEVIVAAARLAVER